MAGGKTSSLTPERIEQAKGLGPTSSTDLAQFFAVNRNTINKWAVRSPEFARCIKRTRKMTVRPQTTIPAQALRVLCSAPWRPRDDQRAA